MKIALASDLHLEFGTISLHNDEGADVLVLSGDIIVEADLTNYDPYYTLGFEYRSNRFHNFFQECSERFPHVVYVLGNHEHYNGDFAKTANSIKEKLSHLKNVYVLDREMKKIDDTIFVGGTLWTDMNNHDSLTLYHVKGMMNDFRIIKNSNVMRTRKVPVYKKKEDGAYEFDEKGFMIQESWKFKEEPGSFSPENSAEEHVKMKEYIKFCIRENRDSKFVVCGHHAPSKLSVKPRYKNDDIMNGAYSSDLSEFILDHPEIKLWTHGHTHDQFDYMVGDTRVVCNPRGYIGYEPAAKDFKLKYIEV